MAFTTLTLTTANAYAGGILDLDAAAVAVDASNGNQFANDGRTRLYVKNGSGSPLTVTYNIPSTIRSLSGAITTITKTVAAGKVAVLGPFNPALFNQTTGYVQVSWSAGTTITALAFNENPTPNV